MGKSMTYEYWLNLLMIYSFIALILFPIVIHLKGNLRLSSKIDNLLVLGLATTFICVFGLRGFEQGTDTNNYVTFFNSVTNYSSYSEFSSENRNSGLGFFIIAKLIHLFSDDPQVFLFVVAAIFISLFTISVFRFVEYNRFILFFSFLSLFFFYQLGINIIRDGISLMLAVVAISYDSTNKRLQWVYFLFSILFHYTTIILIVGWFIVKKLENIRTALIIWTLCLLLSVVGFGLQNILTILKLDFINRFLTFADYTSYVDDATSQGISINGILFNLIFLVYGLYMIKKDESQDKFYKTVFLAYCYLNAIYMLGYGIKASGRLGIISWVLLPYIVGLPIIKYGLVKSKVFLWYVFAILLGCFSFFYIL